jgi:hypothetical protein
MKKQNPRFFIAIGVAIGAGLGVALDNIAVGADEIIVAPGPDADARCLAAWYSLTPEGQLVLMGSVNPFGGSTHGGRVAGGQFFSTGD